jgi:predicted TIM-barrel fold metal-dependent hydrolase
MTRARLVWLALLLPVQAGAQILPLIDAHSQFDDATPVAKVIQLSARAGVSQVLLSARGGSTTEDVVALAAKYPMCIVPAVRTKGRAYAANEPRFYANLDEQLKAPQFKAMSEIILAHAQKGKGAPEVNLSLAAPQVREAIGRAIERGWPVVLHYEFRWYGRAHGAEARAARMAELKALLARHPEQPFALIHLAQLDAGDAGELLAAHANLVFLTSHANPITGRASRQPWSDMFAGDELAPEWSALLLRHPQSFVLAFDNVWPEHWSDRYAQQVKLWRHALGKLPSDVAHAVAHRNAERLWKLSPADAGRGCAAIAH